MSLQQDPKRELLRHTLATLAYRGGKTLRDASPEFADYSAAGRTPIQILAHLGDLMEWSLSMARGQEVWRDAKARPWPQEVARFYEALKKFDDYLASSDTVHAPLERLFQGPIADALTHVGQLAMLRRLAGCPISGENYFVADIATGRVGPEQAAAKKKF